MLPCCQRTSLMFTVHRDLRKIFLILVTKKITSNTAQLIHFSFTFQMPRENIRTENSRGTILEFGHNNSIRVSADLNSPNRRSKSVILFFPSCYDQAFHSVVHPMEILRPYKHQSLRCHKQAVKSFRKKKRRTNFSQFGQNNAERH